MRALSLAVMLCLILAAKAQAEDPVQTAQTLIQGQIEAFLQNDAATAYSFAAPGIKALFPDKDVFFAMVKKSYQPVYHPGNYAFGKSRAIDNGAVVYQEVLITGIDDKDWTAIYQIARQPDGSYKINGVQILPNTASKGI
ncbi:DUF4864 domain-containing protein [Agrobacterium sp. SHOUNA12C]|uniref:DUF4864 domain-containing protein n=2 Tax=Rhizobium rhizogenes TaxID=359 RepID=B9JFB3_RHIR8|nr:DUF4864 domain-containing protein [Rhizobium rhizogenes]ACM26603.1 conserved hypothetical protein [Rhizobium rhizogenes K84]KAA6490604.1 DUF4864 domain-containing protein [Agrobacterium sp. ICMP 7243]MCJ9721949.1 DUF4864 domain-containing protein [Agrobacterium sp. BETTINA12B]MCJ9756555.1 DUF4864 domain-containing protein [Agrobacterium sp. SHOUNA12C]OCJ06116.1 hypothetical protein A6U85_03890 [Agrobacterium sp. 13-626]OCJ25689.1 hypothetical protein A6U88_04385 [Agrobacterium sp. B131/95]